MRNGKELKAGVMIVNEVPLFGISLHLDSVNEMTDIGQLNNRQASQQLLIRCVVE